MCFLNVFPRNAAEALSLYLRPSLVKGEELRGVANALLGFLGRVIFCGADKLIIGKLQYNTNHT